jgi:hypothetical protein
MVSPSPGTSKNIQNRGRFLTFAAACTGEQGQDVKNHVPPGWRKFMNAEKLIQHAAIGKAFTVATLFALALGAVPPANAAQNKGCSVATLNGTFADRDSGYITSPPAFAGPFAGVTLEIFDGNGGFTGSGVSSINGNIIPGTFQGTYTVNADCTGSYTVLNSLGLTIHAFFVIADDGNVMYDVITDPGTVITCVARRVSSKGASED